jgi:plastocyanin
MKTSVTRFTSARAVAMAVACASLALAAGAHGASPARTVEVSITKFTFAPKEITVAPGTKVVWTNRDETPHTVTSKDKTLASPGLDTDDTYEHAFDGEGDFAYICTVHPFMAGVVHVRKP